MRRYVRMCDCVWPLLISTHSSIHGTVTKTWKIGNACYQTEVRLRIEARPLPSYSYIFKNYTVFMSVPIPGEIHSYAHLSCPGKGWKNEGLCRL